MAPEEQATPLIVLFKQISQAMIFELVDRLRAAGYSDITVAHHPVFYNLDADGTRLSELAARAGMTRQSMSELVAVLVRRGYLERQPDPQDGRARLVRPTRRGGDAIRQARAEIAEIEAIWLDRLRAEGLDINLHTVLATALRNVDMKRPMP